MSRGMSTVIAGQDVPVGIAYGYAHQIVREYDAGELDGYKWPSGSTHYHLPWFHNLNEAVGYLKVCPFIGHVQTYVMKEDGSGPSWITSGVYHRKNEEGVRHAPTLDKSMGTAIPPVPASAGNIPAEVRESVKAVINYSWADQKEDYAQGKDTLPNSDAAYREIAKEAGELSHIFCHLARLDQWAFGNENPAEQAEVEHAKDPALVVSCKDGLIQEIIGNQGQMEVLVLDGGVSGEDHAVQLGGKWVRVQSPIVPKVDVETVERIYSQMGMAAGPDEVIGHKVRAAIRSAATNMTIIGDYAELGQASWEAFDALEISPVKTEELKKGHTTCTACPPEEADMWSIYGHLKEGGVQCLLDIEDESDARELANQIARAADLPEPCAEEEMEAGPRM